MLRIISTRLFGKTISYNKMNHYVNRKIKKNKLTLTSGLPPSGMFERSTFDNEKERKK
jgi:hypothetical protein